VGERRFCVGKSHTDGLGLDAVVEKVAWVVGVRLSRPPLPRSREGFRRVRVAAGLIRL
jgi:hypothetical protein